MKNLYSVTFILALVGCECMPEEVLHKRGAAEKNVSSKTVSRGDLYMQPELEQKNSKIWGVPNKSSCDVPSGTKHKSWEAKKDTMAYYAEKKKFPMPKE